MIIVELIFAYPAVGQLFFMTAGGTFTGSQSPEGNAGGEFTASMDVPVVLVLFMLMLTVVAVANTVADLLYAASDPRLSFGAKTER